MSGKIFLITTPEHDDAVDYCSKWSQEVIDAAKTKGFSVINLKKEKANRDEFESRIKSAGPDFVVFNGHGVQNEIRGHNDKVLLKTNENDGLMKGRVVYARSCYSLSGLGKSCWKKGAKAFIRYSLPFMFISDPNRSAHPIKDDLAKPFFASSNLIPLTLLKGNTIKDAIARHHEQIDKFIAFWKTQTVMEASMVVACLMWNKRSLGFEGDESSTI